MTMAVFDSAEHSKAYTYMTKADMVDLSPVGPWGSRDGNAFVSNCSS